jgi:ABC-type glycerol-3-phosphate transport system substrate-binding protein
MEIYMSQSRGPLGRPARRSALLGIVALSAVSALALSACAPGGVGQGAAGPTAVSTAIDKPVALTFYDGAGLKDFDEALISAFEKKNPNIKINLRSDPDAVTNTNMPRIISSNDAPDLVRYPAGAIAGYVKDGVLTNLDSYATAYGWDKLPAAQLSQYRVDNGALGSGSLYAFGAPAGPMTGVFYNRDLAAKIGMDKAPQTLAEFEDALMKAKNAGVTPIISANKTGLTGHVWNLLLGNYMGADNLNAFRFRKPGSTVDNPDALAATKTLQNWMQSGYFNSDQNALEQDPSYGRFMNGDALFTVQGSWVLGPLKKMVDAGNLGFFPLPGTDASHPATAMSSTSLSFAIPAKSKNHDAAAAFLNWVQSPEAAAAAYDSGFSAKAPDATTTFSMSDNVQKQLSNSYAKAVADNALTGWVADVTQGMATSALNPGLQQLAANQVSPEQFLTTVQKTYEDQTK